MVFPVLFVPYIGHSTTAEGSHCNWIISNILVTHAFQLNHFLLNSTMRSLMYIFTIVLFLCCSRAENGCAERERGERESGATATGRAEDTGWVATTAIYKLYRYKYLNTRPWRTGQVIASKLTDTERDWFGFKGKYLGTDKDIPEIKNLKLKDMSYTFLRKSVVSIYVGLENLHM